MAGPLYLMFAFVLWALQVTLVFAGDARLAWFQAKDVLADCPLVASYPVFDALPVSVQAQPDNTVLAFGYGRSCIDHLRPAGDHYHDSYCNAATNTTLLDMLLVSTNSAAEFYCLKVPTIGRYHATYVTFGDSSYSSTCVIGGQLPRIQDGLTVGATLTTSVLCRGSWAGVNIYNGPALPFPILRATAVEYSGHVVIIGGLRPGSAPDVPLIVAIDDQGRLAGEWLQLSPKEVGLFANRIDAWSIAARPGFARHILPLDTLKESALIAGGGYVLPNAAYIRSDLTAFRFSDYFSSKAVAYEYTDVWVMDENITCGLRGECYGWALIQAYTPGNKGRSHALVASVVYPTGDHSLLGSNEENSVARVMFAGAGIVWLASNLRDGVWHALEHTWSLPGDQDRVITRPDIPTTDHTLITTVRVSGESPEPLVIGWKAGARGPSIWRGFVRACSSCGQGTYEAARCQLSPFENICRSCRECGTAPGPRTEFEFLPCILNLDTVCVPCRKCPNGTLTNCSATDDAVCLEAEEVNFTPQVVEDGMIYVGDSRTYEAMLSSALLLCALVSAGVLGHERAAAVAKGAARSGKEVETCYSTTKRVARRMRLVFVPLVTSLTYAYFDASLLSGGSMAGSHSADAARVLLSTAAMGIAASVAAALCNFCDTALWLSFAGRHNLSAMSTGRGGRGGLGLPPSTLALLALLPLVHTNTFLLHHLRRMMVMNTEWAQTALAAVYSVYCRACSGRAPTSGQQRLAAISTCWNSSSSVVAAMKACMLLACFVGDGLHLVSVFSVVLEEGSQPIFLPPLLAAGVVVCSVMNITLVAMAVSKHGRLVGEGATSHMPTADFQSTAETPVATGTTCSEAGVGAAQRAHADGAVVSPFVVMQGQGSAFTRVATGASAVWADASAYPSPAFGLPGHHTYLPQPVGTTGHVGVDRTTGGAFLEPRDWQQPSTAAMLHRERLMYKESEPESLCTAALPSVASSAGSEEGQGGTGHAEGGIGVRQAAGQQPDAEHVLLRFQRVRKMVRESTNMS